MKALKIKKHVPRKRFFDPAKKQAQLIQRAFIIMELDSESNEDWEIYNELNKPWSPASKGDTRTHFVASYPAKFTKP